MRRCKHCGETIHENKTHHCEETGESYTPDILDEIIAIETLEGLMDFSDSNISTDSLDTSSDSIDFGGGDFGGGGGGSDW